jgi:regulator of nucleoside diphosphate kinase
MTRSAQATTKAPRKPRVVDDAARIEKIEALASGAMAPSPDLADRLLGELVRAKVVASARLQPNVVTIGNTVTFRNETTRQEPSVSLVFPKDAEIFKGRASVMTPIGVTLLGLAEGAVFNRTSRNGATHKLTIMRVGGDGRAPRYGPGRVRCSGHTQARAVRSATPGAEPNQPCAARRDSGRPSR